jgi:DNA replication licensing factor MCM2
MEQQTISVSKAGIVCSLQARCAVFAAANPIGGRYDPAYTLSENVELTDPILQRFDILCVLQDIIDPVVDQQLATFVIGSHVRSHPDYKSKKPEEIVEEAKEDRGPQPLEQDVLRKYITYARANVKPVLQDIDSEKIAALYADLRSQSMASGGVPIAVRHIESICRMSEASARMHLRQYVREDDVDMAIKVMLESFLQAQKVSVRRALQQSFRKYITFGEESNQLLMHQLQALFRDAEKIVAIQQRMNKQSKEMTVHVYIEEFENRARIMNIYDLRPFYASAIFRSHGMRLDVGKGCIVWAHS